jgi:hypothetical protein
VLSLAIQCTIVQGHFHPGAQAAWGNAAKLPAVAVAGAKAGGDLSITASPGDASGRTRVGCLLCEQLALAGSTILPEDTAPVHVAMGKGAAQISHPSNSALLAVSHDWRSRAPPTFL